MSPESVSNAAQPRRRCRFRFGLKTVFVVMTFFCIWLGGLMARQHQSAAVVARYRAVSDVIQQNYIDPPHGTTFKRALLLQPRVGRDVRPSNRFRIIEPRGWLLDIAGLLATTGDMETAATAIHEHYARGLADLSLKQTAHDNFGRPVTAIWEMPEHGLYVLIDVDVDEPSTEAEVRIIFLHNEKLSIW